MGDSFVDVTYRGLEVGRRLRIRDFTADAAYVEAPTPMPVGTQVEIATDTGLTLLAIVSRVHEQVGGSDRAPGMKVRPTLDHVARVWWDKMAVESPAPIEPAALARPRAPSAPIPVAVPREETLPAQPESGPVAVVIDEPDAARTDVMPVIHDDAPGDDGGGNGEVVDDGKRTQVMASADIEAIMAEASGPIRTDARAASEGGEDDSGDTDLGDEDVSQDGPATSGGNGTPGATKKKRSRRRKKK